MSALKKLIEFNSKLPIELREEQFLLTSELIKEFIQEKIKLIDDYERIIRATQVTKPYDVVAIAGTAEQLLNDVTDKNVGEINVGDTVECIAEMSKPIGHIIDPICYKGYTTNVVGVYAGNIYIPYSESGYKKSDFRKVSAPIVNPLNTVEGC